MGSLMPLVQANVTQPSMERRRHKADIDGSQCRAKGGDCQVSTTFMPNRSTHTCPCSSNPRPRSFKKHQYSSAIWKHPNTPAKLKTERFMPCSVLPPPLPAQPSPTHSPGSQLDLHMHKWLEHLQLPHYFTQAVLEPTIWVCKHQLEGAAIALQQGTHDCEAH